MDKSKIFSSFPKQHILDSSKLKKFADNSFQFNENGVKFSKWLNNAVEEIAGTWTADK